MGIGQFLEGSSNVCAQPSKHFLTLLTVMARVIRADITTAEDKVFTVALNYFRTLEQTINNPNNVLFLVTLRARRSFFVFSRTHTKQKAKSL